MSRRDPRLRITEKDVAKRRLVPDVSRMIERYVNRDVDRIYELAIKIYQRIIPFMINEEFIDKDLIINKFVNLYIEKFGTNFTEFLERHIKQIRKNFMTLGIKFLTKEGKVKISSVKLKRLILF